MRAGLLVRQQQDEVHPPSMCAHHGMLAMSMAAMMCREPLQSAQTALKMTADIAAEQVCTADTVVLDICQPGPWHCRMQSKAPTLCGEHT